MKLIYKIPLLLLSFYLSILVANAQRVISFEEVLENVASSSFTSQSAKNDRAFAEWSFKFYNSQKKPQIGLGLNLPNYSKTSSAIIQPDGTIAFQSIRQANSSVGAYGSQILSATGGTFFINSDIQRFDDFTTDLNQYNGIPIRLGIRQAIFGFNPWKYQNIIQPLFLEESKKEYNVRMEAAFTQAASLYFDILIFNQNLEIAKTNQEVNSKLLQITEERFTLGKVTRDEKLQLEIELNSSELSVSQATSNKQQAIARLFSFMGMISPLDSLVFNIPKLSTVEELNVEKLMSAYKINRPELLAYKRSLEESEMNISKAKSDYGFQANIQASIGLARGSEKISDIYTDPFDEQQFNLSIQIPVLDWGRKKAVVQQMKIKKDNAIASYQQDILELENKIQQEALLFLRLQNEITLFKKIMDTAEERFSISNERYILGDLDITNLTIAQREKDQAKRNYINALKSYWLSYYTLRSLTGYDVIKKQEIIYN